MHYTPFVVLNVDTGPVNPLLTSLLDPGPYRYYLLKGLSHEIDFKNFDKILQNLA